MLRTPPDTHQPLTPPRRRLPALLVGRGGGGPRKAPGGTHPIEQGGPGTDRSNRSEMINHMTKYVIPREGHEIRLGYDVRERTFHAQGWSSTHDILFILGTDNECGTAEDLKAVLAERLDDNGLARLTDDEAVRLDELLDNIPHHLAAVMVTELVEAVTRAEETGDTVMGSHNIDILIGRLARNDRLEGLGEDENGELTGVEDSLRREFDRCSECGRFRVEHRNRTLWPAACQTYTRS